MLLESSSASGRALPLLLLALIGSLIWTAAPAAAAGQTSSPQDPPPPESEPAEVATAEAGAEVETRKARKNRRNRPEPGAGGNAENLVAKIWWNQPKKVEELGLTDDQRSRMNRSLEAFLAERQSFRDRSKAALAEFGEALGKGDMDSAKELAGSVAEASSLPSKLQTEMMIEVVSVLTPEQRQKLVGNYPKLLSRLWILSANPRAERMLGARGQ